MLKGHAVTLTFKKWPKCSATCCLNMMIIYVKKCKIRLQITKLWDTNLLLGHAVTLTFKVAAQMLHATRRLNMVIISVK